MASAANREKGAELAAILNRLNDEEAQVVLDAALEIARRMETGRTRYQPLDLDNDPRDWLQQTVEELADGIAYVRMAMIQRERERRR